MAYLDTKKMQKIIFLLCFACLVYVVPFICQTVGFFTPKWASNATCASMGLLYSCCTRSGTNICGNTNGADELHASALKCQAISFVFLILAVLSALFTICMHAFGYKNETLDFVCGCCYTLPYPAAGVLSVIGCTIVTDELSNVQLGFSYYLCMTAGCTIIIISVLLPVMIVLTMLFKDNNTTEQGSRDKNTTEHESRDKSMTEQESIDKSATEQDSRDKSKTKQDSRDKCTTEQKSPVNRTTVREIDDNSATVQISHDNITVELEWHDNSTTEQESHDNSMQKPRGKSKTEQDSRDKGVIEQASRDKGTTEQETQDKGMTEQESRDKGMNEQESCDKGTSEQESQDKSMTEQECHHKGMTEQESREKGMTEQESHYISSTKQGSYDNSTSEQESTDNSTTVQESHENSTSEQGSQDNFKAQTQHCVIVRGKSHADASRNKSNVWGNLGCRLVGPGQTRPTKHFTGIGKNTVEISNANEIVFTSAKPYFELRRIHSKW